MNNIFRFQVQKTTIIAGIKKSLKGLQDIIEMGVKIIKDKNSTSNKIKVYHAH